MLQSPHLSEWESCLQPMDRFWEGGSCKPNETLESVASLGLTFWGEESIAFY